MIDLAKLKHRLFFYLVKVLVLFSPAASYMVYAGAGSARQLCAHVVRSGARRVLVVTDRPLRELGIADQAVAALLESEVEVVWYDGVQPDPTFSQVEEGISLLRRERCDAVLAVGGGSSIDAAKIIAAGASSEQNPRDWIGFGKVKHEVMPLYAIPTTSGTGSEATMGAVISDPVSHEKSILSGAGLLPRAAALDSDLTLGLPPAITAATGMDALTHAIEAYIATWERGTRKQHARMAVRLIFDHLRTACRDGGDRTAREAMATAAYYAGIAINQVNVGNVHAIAHQLGGKYGIPHGVANALVLPHILEWCRYEAQADLAELACLIGAAGDSQPPEQQALAFIDAVRALARDVGIPEKAEPLRSEDFDYLVGLAVTEASGYFAPRLLDGHGARAVLAKIAP
jgi:alcohol dehydrogenase class IV